MPHRVLLPIPRKLTPCAVLLLVLSSPQIKANAAPEPHWVGTWAAAPMAALNTNGDYREDTTLREIVHISIGGSAVRVTLSNEFGTEELKIGGATIGLSNDHGGLKGAPHPLTFDGHSDISIPPGTSVISDPVSLSVPALSELAITIFVPGQTVSTITQHVLSYQTNYSTDGNHLADTDLVNAKKFYSWPFVKTVDVSATAQAAAIVCLGDSITDGVLSTRDKNARWPDELARRLQANKATASVGVLNLGISGNRLLHDTTGPSALSRFDRDVLGQSGVRYLIVLEGINDIGRTTHPNRPTDPITTSRLSFALNQIIERAHAHGIKVYGATLTPYGGAKTETEQGDAMRTAENDFIRNSGRFDAVVDFDKATRDPANPLAFLPSADGGDHVHPSDAGYKAMGDAIDLELFTR
jgi:lysophospholipase L1-like esterase